MENQSDISDKSYQAISITPKTLIDEVSSTLYYVGVSINGDNTSGPIWSIRKIEKSGNVWNISTYPNGNQGFEFIWNNRATYTYA